MTKPTDTHLVLTVICDDKPGIVQLLAQTINQHHGNWQESRMAHLAGKFAGILQVTLAAEHQDALCSALTNLADKGLKVVVEVAAPSDQPLSKTFAFSVVGNDRPGIVYEVAQAFAGSNINMDELETNFSSMPWSGEPLFEATGTIEVPEHVDMDALYEQLDVIADELAVDIRLESSVTHE